MIQPNSENVIIANSKLWKINCCHLYYLKTHIKTTFGLFVVDILGIDAYLSCGAALTCIEVIDAIEAVEAIDAVEAIEAVNTIEAIVGVEAVAVNVAVAGVEVIMHSNLEDVLVKNFCPNKSDNKFMKYCQ